MRTDCGSLRDAARTFTVRACSSTAVEIHVTVPVTQSEALDAVLTEVGAEHELVIVPDAPHTFNLQPNQRDLRPLVFQFFEKHLKVAHVAKTDSPADEVAGKSATQ